MQITLGSLFDGSGGFPLAGSLCGITPIWASEIEPYPVAVTKSRFPQMKHLGDISKVNGAEIEPVDVVTFGSPCQDLSVAGKRAGLKHETNGDKETTRSGLFMEAIRIIKEMRRATHGKYPRFALWENVPGAFSSNKGEDFRLVLEELIKIAEAKATVPAAPKGGWPYADAYVGDGWSLAYRTFDAQYWGVPQRRRRIYLVADFAGGCAPGILFEREGLRGYFEAGESPWKRTAAGAQGSIGTDGCENKANEISGCVTLANIASTLRAGAGAPKHRQDCIGRLVLNPVGAAIDSEGGSFIDVEVEVSGRKYKVDCALLCKCLREHKSALNLSNREIAEKLGQPVTLVEHWFRADAGFAVPKPNVWRELKTLLGIKTNEFDKSILEFEHKGGVYDTQNRIYVGDASPTLTCGCGNNLHLLSEKRPLCCLPDNPNGCLFIEEKNNAMGIDGYNSALTGNQASTLGVNCGMSTGRNGVVYAVGTQQGGAEISRNGICPTITAAAGMSGNNQPWICAEDNEVEKGRPLVLFEPRSHDGVPRIHKTVAPTLNTAQGGQRQPCVAVSVKQYPFCKSSRPSFKGDSETYITCKVSNTLNTFDLGDKRANELIVEDVPVYCVQGNCIDRADTAGCNGKGWREGASFTLNTIDRPAIAYAMTSGSFMQVNKEASPTLAARDYKGAPLVCFDDAAQIYGQNSYAGYGEGVGGTLTASGGSYGGGSESLIVEHKPRYIVRRLTPTECARLQGFADEWGFLEHKDDLADEEYEFWLDVRNTHAVINGRKEKEYTKAQILSWYNRLHSDSSEYKMWGNGVALPPTLYCIQGISDALSEASYGGEEVR